MASKPLSALIATAQAKQAPPDDVDRAAATCIYALTRIYDETAQQINCIARHAATHGMYALTGAMTEVQAGAFLAALAGMQQVWGAMSDEPWPDMPGKPVPAETETLE